MFGYEVIPVNIQFLNETFGHELVHFVIFKYSIQLLLDFASTVKPLQILEVVIIIRFLVNELNQCLRLPFVKYDVVYLFRVKVVLRLAEFLVQSVVYHIIEITILTKLTFLHSKPNNI